MNATAISNGVLAAVTGTLSGSNSASIGLINGGGAAADGSALPLTATGGLVSVPTATVTASSILCSPSTLGPGASSACTVTVSASSGAIVNLTSNSASLTVPASVTVPAGSSVATFLATAGQFTVNQTPTITASLGGSSQTTTVSLVSPPTVSALQCAVTSLAANSNTTCTVTLSKPALANGATVILASTNAALVVPASVTVPANDSSAIFSITTGSLPSSQSVSITSTYNGASASFNLSLIGTAPGLVSVNCVPNVLSAGGSSACTVTLSTASPSGSSVSLSSNNANLTVPAGVAIASGAMSGVFNAIAGSGFTTDQTASITATLNSAALSTSLNLLAPADPPFVSGLSCSPALLLSNASTTCTVTLTKAAPAGGTLVTISSSNTALTAPASVTVNVGATTAVFTATTATLSTDQTATLTAKAGASSASAVLGLGTSALVSSLSCNPASLSSNTSTNCTITLTKAAPAGGTLVTLSNTNSSLSVPTSMTVPSGASTAVFSASTSTLLSDQTVTLTATTGNSSTSATINLVSAALLSSLSCTPASLGSNASTSCTVTLTKSSPAGGTLVTLSNTSSALTAPASITVSAGANTAQFTASTSTVSADQTATLTATTGSSSVSAAIGLGAATVVSSLSCNPASLGSNSSSTCSVTLTKAAPANGISIALTSSTTALMLPPSVTVPAAATSNSFSVTTTAILSDQIAILTAKYGGNSVNTDISLLAPALISGIVCNPASIGPNSSSACTVSLTRNAGAGGAVVVVATTNSLLIAPASLTIAAGSASASLSVAAGSFTTTQSGSVTVAYNGSSASAAIQLLAGTFVTSLSCSPTTVTSGNTSVCTVALSAPAPANTTVAISSSSTLVTAPPNIVVPAGSSTQTFNATAGAITADTTAVITTTLGTSSQSASLSLSTVPTLSSLICTPTKLTVGASASCTANLSKPTSGVFITIASSNPALIVPSGIAVPQGSTSASFTVTLQTSAPGSISISATYNGTTQGAVFTIAAGNTVSGLSRLRCHPKSLQVGTRGLCRLALSVAGNLPGSEVQLRSSSDAIRLPARLHTRAGQSSVEFQIEASPENIGTVVVQAQLGDDVVTDTIAIAPDRSQPIRVPDNQYVRYGSELRFHVSPSDPSATLSTLPLPPGAYFDANTGEFHWIPDYTQLGAHEIQFAASDSAGVTATATVKVQVETGEPVITGIINAASRSSKLACGPGAIAAVQGRWFTDAPPTSDPAGISLQLAGVKLLANGAATPLLSASAGELRFLCPQGMPGSNLQIEVQTDHGISAPAETVTQAAAPGIFSLEQSGSTPSAVLLGDGSGFAVVRNHLVAGQPALPGEHVAVYATGIEGMTNVAARFGDLAITPDSITPIPNRPGLFQIAFTIPYRAADGETLLSLTGDAPGGVAVTSNLVSVALEGDSR